MSLIPFCTMGSLSLGVAALVLPVAAAGKKTFYQKHRNWIIGGSFAFCAAALQLQLEAAASWARTEDVSALLDCCNAQALAGRMLLAAVILVNAVCRKVLRGRSGGEE